MCSEACEDETYEYVSDIAKYGRYGAERREAEHVGVVVAWLRRGFWGRRGGKGSVTPSDPR
ncbi:hypothetical protein E2C01_060888 [Portunus trituberculatus]|uniref:Uncharacterized protein n=1 Tax=Portunus trituberculatus TaxID=210409 RepID=A0A5B7H9X4_PORTR|nr:hypothetical protein [Portunus trituberculatus]